jgi:Cd2+/Zn2+-exporting ATPase
VEKLSEHPLAVAIVRHAMEKGIPLAKAGDFRAITGKGAKAVVDGKEYIIGNPRLFEESGIDLSSIKEKIAQVQSDGKTCMLLGSNGQVLGVIAVADQIRQKSVATVQSLKKNGIDKVIMLTGDNEATARAIASKLNIDYRAELLPQDKVSAVKELRETYKYIGMVGDGINDAPALATATIGIAMGGAGTDTAMETADIVLMADDLSKLPFTVKLSRSALKVIKQNIAFSIFIKVIATFLVFPGWLTLWLAIFADMGASILVTLNGIRLLRIKSE